jgi:FdhD protein
MAESPDTEQSTDASRTMPVLRWEEAKSGAADDQIAHEEPLEIQIGGVPVSVVMRTPGNDEELGLGFLVTERIIAGVADVVSIRHCSTAAEPEAEGNILRIVLKQGVDVPLERLRRNTFASSSCGVCGKATIDAALSTGNPVERGPVAEPQALYAMPDRLRAAQRTFEATGGLHAAGLFTPSGELVLVREDVGRHNAVDKVIGAATLGGPPPQDHVLFVSGRVSFEIVQKAAAARLAIVAGISAPTTLAVRFGEALGVTVVGFVRGRTMNVYSRSERIVTR